MSATNISPQPTPTGSRFYPTFFLCLLLGLFGGHRFYTGKFKSGLIQLVTLGGFGAWTLADMLLLLAGRFKGKDNVPMPNVSPGLSWSIFMAVLVLAIASQGGTSGQSTPANPSRSQIPVRAHSGRKSASQLAREYAKTLHGSDAHVEVQEGFYGGSMQVVVRVPITDGIYAGGYDRYSYTATVDMAAQRVTSWELYEHN